MAVFDAGCTLAISQPVIDVGITQDWWNAMNHGSRSLELGSLQRDLQPPEIVGTYPNNRNIPLKLATLQSYVALKNRFYDAMLADPLLTQMATGDQRFCFAVSPAWLRPNNGDFPTFVNRSHQLGHPLLVLHTPESMKTISDPKLPQTPSTADVTAGAICSPVKVTALHYTETQLSFTYVADRAGWLMVTDRWAPDWNVRVNGKAEQIVGADFLYRAVHVDAGANRVDFTYDPKSFYVLTFFSWTLLGLIAMVELCGLILRHRRQVRLKTECIPLSS